MSSWALRLVLAAIVAAGCCSSASADEAADAFNAVYGEDLKKAAATPDKTDDVALAAKLLTAAKAVTGQPALMAILCDKAWELGKSHPSGCATAIEAMQLLARQAPERAAECKDKVMALCQAQFDKARGADRYQVGEDMIGSLADAAETRAAAGDPAGASEFCKRALAIVMAIKSENVGAVQALMTRYTVRARVEKQAADLKARLVADPADAAARRELLRLNLVELDNPAEALKYVAEDADEATRKLLPGAAKGVEAAPMLACMELAQWYKGLVAGANDPAKVPLLKRAIAYGQRFLWLRPPDEAAVARAKQLLDECRGRVARLQPEIRPPGREFLPEMQAVAPTTVKAVAGGVELTCKTDTGRFWTRSKFKPPFQADFLVSVQSGDPLKPEKTCSIRLHYGPKGELMFNWEVRPDELRVQDISGDRGTSANGGCRIPNGKLTLITWIMRPTEMRVLVDGRELLTWPGAYAGVESPIDVTAARGSIVTVKSVIVRKLRK
jgi:hypothetical protein